MGNKYKGNIVLYTDYKRETKFLITFANVKYKAYRKYEQYHLHKSVSFY